MLFDGLAGAMRSSNKNWQLFDVGRTYQHDGYNCGLWALYFEELFCDFLRTRSNLVRATSFADFVRDALAPVESRSSQFMERMRTKTCEHLRSQFGGATISNAEELAIQQAIRLSYELGPSEFVDNPNAR